MKRILGVLMLAGLVAGCGADGQPIQPSLNAGIGIGPNGVNPHVGVGLHKGPVGVHLGF